MSKTSGFWFRWFFGLLWMAVPRTSVAWPSSPARPLHQRTARSRAPRLATTLEAAAGGDGEGDGAARSVVLGRGDVSGAGAPNVLGTDLLFDAADAWPDPSGLAAPAYRRRCRRLGARPGVCVHVTEDFLRYAREANDPDAVAGAAVGDLRRVSPATWIDAYNAGRAPWLLLQATPAGTLDHIPLDVLRVFAIDGDDAAAVLQELGRERSRLDGLARSVGNGVRDGEDSSFQ